MAAHDAPRSEGASFAFDVGKGAAARTWGTPPPAD